MCRYFLDNSILCLNRIFYGYKHYKPIVNKFEEFPSTNCRKKELANLEAKYAKFLDFKINTVVIGNK